ncbi:hypothetical protein K440DRAFT_490954, partial [Wilcoxina mikolae CBS 423.85]
MCFYNQHTFICGDYKWGHFRAQCNKVHETDKTCVMKLIFETIRAASKCPTCKKYESIWRKIAQTREIVAIWEFEGASSVSTDRERANIVMWQRQLRDIEHETRAQANLRMIG